MRDLHGGPIRAQANWKGTDMKGRTLLRGGAAVAAGIAAAAIAQTGKWPSKEITLINPNAPGASADLTARLLAQALEKRLNA
ncbi:MAG TPA: hypothetical protein PKA20_04115, partial [Burkholderiaceae bacterium]|nr:hypothetical protein [Burkholderiaceae bacterium]